MKKFSVAEIEALELNETAFGPNDPTSVDEAKHAVTDANGNVLGYKEQYGEHKSSN